MRLVIFQTPNKWGGYYTVQEILKIKYETIKVKLVIIVDSDLYEFMSLVLFLIQKIKGNYE